MRMWDANNRLTSLVAWAGWACILGLLALAAYDEPRAGLIAMVLVATLIAAWLLATSVLLLLLLAARSIVHLGAHWKHHAHA